MLDRHTVLPTCKDGTFRGRGGRKADMTAAETLAHSDWDGERSSSASPALHNSSRRRLVPSLYHGRNHSLAKQLPRRRCHQDGEKERVSHRYRQAKKNRDYIVTTCRGKHPRAGHDSTPLMRTLGRRPTGKIPPPSSMARYPLCMWYPQGGPPHGASTPVSDAHSRRDAAPHSSPPTGGSIPHGHTHQGTRGRLLPLRAPAAVAEP